MIQNKAITGNLNNMKRLFLFILLLMPFFGQAFTIKSYNNSHYYIMNEGLDTTIVPKYNTTLVLYAPLVDIVTDEYSWRKRTITQIKNGDNGGAYFTSEAEFVAYMQVLLDSTSSGGGGGSQGLQSVTAIGDTTNILVTFKGGAKVNGLSLYNNPVGTRLLTLVPLMDGNNYNVYFPAGSDTVVELAAPQTMTQKTLTSPKINVTSDASFDMYYRSALGIFTRIPYGTTNQTIIATTGAAPSWKAITPAMLGTSPTAEKIYRGDGTWGQTGLSATTITNNSTVTALTFTSGSNATSANITYTAFYQSAPQNNSHGLIHAYFDPQSGVTTYALVPLMINGTGVIGLSVTILFNGEVQVTSTTGGIVRWYVNATTLVH